MFTHNITNFDEVVNFWYIYNEIITASFTHSANVLNLNIWLHCILNSNCWSWHIDIEVSSNHLYIDLWNQYVNNMIGLAVMVPHPKLVIVIILSKPHMNTINNYGKHQYDYQHSMDFKYTKWLR